MVHAPLQDLRHVREAHSRLREITRGLTDEQSRRPTMLPGWSVGHVLTHLARNADSARRRTLGALRGEQVEQYRGGAAGRDAEIEAGAGRPARALVDDAVRAGLDLDTVWSTLPEHLWEFEVAVAARPPQPLAALPARRWREVQVHLVDLALGVTHRDWPDCFVERWLPALRRGMDARLPAGGAPPVPGTLDERDELAWLFGRLRPGGLPDLLPWG